MYQKLNKNLQSQQLLFRNVENSTKILIEQKFSYFQLDKKCK